MAREALARQFDVDEDSVTFKRLTQTGKYDQGRITFKAKKGKRISLDKLHESLWATRLSGGTKSGLLSLEVTVVGEVVVDKKQTIVRVTGSRDHFVLGDDPKVKRKDGEKEAAEKSAFTKMRNAIASGKKVINVTGRLDGWHGVWPEVLQQLPPKPRRLILSGFETASAKRK